MAEARILFHLPARYMGSYARTMHLGIFARIAETLGPLGAQISVHDRRERDFEGGRRAAADYADGHLHIIENGRVRAPGVLNAALSYIQPYFHLDPRGVLAESSIAQRAYDPASLPAGSAGAFLEQMRQRLVIPRKSRHQQSEAVQAVPPGCLAVFLQGQWTLNRGLAFVPPHEMLRAVAIGAQGRAVLAKPHPLALEHDLAAIAQVQAEGFDVQPSTANLHDILAACAATVSFNSAVALEGYLHGKPTVLFGPSDFHHIADTVRDPSEFPAALARALTRDPGGYARYMQWYFSRQCLNIRGAQFVPRVLRIFANAGFPADRLGLTLR